MAKRPTRAAAGAKRPAARKPPTKRAAAGKTPAKAATSRAGKPGAEVEAVAKGRAAAVATPKSAKAKTPAATGKPVAASKAKPEAAGKAKPAAKGADAANARRATAAQRGAPAPRARAKARPSKVIPPYLAAELGQPVDHEGEPIGAGSRAAFADTELQKYTLQLWQQMQSRRGVNLHLPAMERAGVTIDQIWTTGVTDRLTTSSTADEVRRYRQKLLFRANLLESILTETVSELNRLNSVEPAPAPPPSVGESG